MDLFNLYKSRKNCIVITLVDFEKIVNVYTNMPKLDKKWNKSEFMKILLLSETHMPDRRPIRDRHARCETSMPDTRETLRYAQLEKHRRPTCRIEDPLRTGMSDYSPYIIPI